MANTEQQLNICSVSQRNVTLKFSSSLVSIHTFDYTDDPLFEETPLLPLSTLMGQFSGFLHYFGFSFILTNFSLEKDQAGIKSFMLNPTIVLYN